MVMAKRVCQKKNLKPRGRCSVKLGFPVNNIDRELMLRILEYDQESGFLYWRPRKETDFPNRKTWSMWTGRYDGKRVGSIDGNGYVSFKYNTRTYQAHRVIWTMVNGEIGNFEIDHKNRIRTDNRIENLRVATKLQNQRNRSLASNNNSGVSGVYFHSGIGKWCASLRIDGKPTHLGTFEDITDAIFARKSAEEKYWEST